MIIQTTGCVALFAYLALTGFVNAFQQEDVLIEKLVVTSNVSMRFSEVTFQGRLRNLDTEKSKSTSFDMTLPKSAFITAFSITIDGVEHSAEVKEKSVALGEYTKALEDDVTAGYVSQQSQLHDYFDRDKFSISVNIAPDSTASFSLRYQELIQRKGNVYKQKIYVNPRLEVAQLEVVYEITETQAFKSFQFRTPFADNPSFDVDNESSDYKKLVSWRPSESDLEENIFEENDAFDVLYDLMPVTDGGVLVVNEAGQFAHFFSTLCNSDGILPKQLVLVIDISGSMKGTPIAQVKIAMMSILDQLRNVDSFNIVLFSGKLRAWDQSFVRASPENIQRAKQYLERSLIANGATRINDALLKGLSLFKSSSENLSGRILVLLTDGRPTAGERDTAKIRQNVRNANYQDETCCQASIFTVAFGQDSGRDFLEILASENSGTIKIVKEKDNESNHLVLFEFFTDMENPYFTNVNFTFTSDGLPLPASNMTQHVFPLFDCGEELIVGGWSAPNHVIEPRVVAESMNGVVSFDSVNTNIVTDTKGNVLEKLIVYKHIQELLKQVKSAIDKSTEEDAKEEALSLALQHGLVTPLTSMVVTSYFNRPANSRGPAMGSKSAKAMPNGFIFPTQQPGPTLYEGIEPENDAAPRISHYTVTYTAVLFILSLATKIPMIYQ